MYRLLVAHLRIVQCSLSSMSRSPQVPDSFCCATDPVTVQGSGHTYERSSIEEWFAKHTTDPILGKELKKSERALIPCDAMSSAIEEWHNSLPFNISYSIAKC